MESVGPAAHLPRHLAERIKRVGPYIGGERKRVTILFADIQGSTEMIEDLDPELAAGRLDQGIKVMCDAVHRFEGVVNKVLGDGIMALFGAPLAHEDHHVRACYAALEMRDAFAEMADDGLGIRVGLHSGEVLIRSVSNDLSIEYDAIGAIVNIASRMEQIAEPGAICASEEVCRRAEGFVVTRPIGDRRVKGIRDPISVHEIVGSTPARSRWEARAARQLSEFVNRETEFAAIARAANGARAGHGQLVALVGDAGMGKSRLAHELVRSMLSADWNVLKTGATPLGSNTALLPFSRMFRDWLDVEDHDSRAEIAAKVDRRLAALDPALSSHVPAVEAILDLPVGDVEWARMEAPERGRRMIDAIGAFVLTLSRAKPTALIIEDLHWIDAQSAGVIDSLRALANDASVLLVVTHRHEFSREWSAPDEVVRVPVDPLGLPYTDKLVTALIGEDVSLRHLKGRLAARTSGNPLFVEEMVRALIEVGTLQGDVRNYRMVKGSVAIDVPESVWAILAARIDRLPPDQKTVLQLASVIGGDISYDLLHQLANLPASDLDAALEQLRAAGFISVDKRTSVPIYAFRHSLMVDVAYASQLKQGRRELHAELVRIYEDRYQDRIEEHVDRIAHHARAGELWEKAVHYLQRAAQKASAISAYSDGVNLFDQAIEALAQLPQGRETSKQAIDIQLGLRNALVPLGELKRAMDGLRKAETEAVAIDDHRRLAKINIWRTNALTLQGDLEDAIRYGRRAVDIAGDVGDRSLLVWAQYVLGEAYLVYGRFPQATETLRHLSDAIGRGPAIADDESMGRRAVFCLGHLSTSLAFRADFAGAIAEGEEACRIADNLGEPYPIGFANFCLSNAHIQQGDLDAGLAVAERGQAICEKSGIHLLLPFLMLLRAHAAVTAGEPGTAVAMLANAVTQCVEMNLKLFETWSRVELGFAHLADGSVADALDQVEQARKLIDRHKYLWLEPEALRLLAVASQTDDSAGLAGPEQSLLDAIRIAEDIEMVTAEAHAHRALGEIYARHHRSEPAREHLEKARDIYQSHEMTLWLPEVEDRIAGLS